ncbi:hypothetical protein L596_022041 [Steinernema carpocapsae]|uniref:Uncharacterized protein n=1 Tax=Steinernema carpocapsae TaxID=34508 RepID=A0A4U5MKK4_STECR|nr:hypothetical protein L596_022041 [Steinernema carpocapsae]
MNQTPNLFLNTLFWHLAKHYEASTIAVASDIAGKVGKLASQVLENKRVVYHWIVGGLLEESYYYDVYGKQLDSVPENLLSKDIVETCFDYHADDFEVPDPDMSLRTLVHPKTLIKLVIHSQSLTNPWANFFCAWRNLYSVQINVEFNDKIMDFVDRLVEQKQLVNFDIWFKNYGPREIGVALKLFSQDQFRTMALMEFKSVLYKKIMGLWKQNKAKMEHKEITFHGKTRIDNIDKTDTYWPVSRVLETSYYYAPWRNRKAGVVPVIYIFNDDAKPKTTKKTYLKGVSKSLLSFQYMRATVVPDYMVPGYSGSRRSSSSRSQGKANIEPRRSSRIAERPRKYFGDY